ncbi:MAG: hypothetical protein Q8N79_01465 [Candidatus Methanoperedens sp.]|nr:hypothetical protein [Candidatus Methanoperedens sp.]
MIEKPSEKNKGLSEYFGVLKDSKALNDVEDVCKKIRASVKKRF